MATTAPRVWMDLTTSLRAGGGQSNGTLRVERSYATALPHLLGERIAFCRYDRTRQRFSPADPRAALQAGPNAAESQQRGPGASDAGKNRVGRRVERAMRLFVGDLVQRIYRSVRGGNAARQFPAANPGDVLFLAGETWGARYDFDVLAHLRRERGLQIVALCQDLIPATHPQFFESGEFIARYERYVDFLTRDTDLVVAISKATGAELVRAAQSRGAPAGQIAVVELGSDVASTGNPQPPQFDPPLAPGGFVIAVSTIQSRKNFDLLYRLWRRFADEGRTNVPKLLIVGQRGFGSDDLLWQIAHDPAVRDTIAVMHRASDVELAWLYENCRYAVYPSFAEGWGLPVSECLAHGKFCLASDASSLPEAGAGLAQHLDPHDFSAWHQAIVALADHPDRLAEAEARIRAGYVRKTWQGSAADLADRLTALLERTAP